MNKRRQIFFFKDYFRKFYESQNQKVQEKIIWTLKIVEEINRVPEIYLKYLKNSNGIYEMRVQVGTNIFRIFCFFDQNNLVVVGHGFQKKTQKTPKQEIEKAEQIKNEYYGSKI